MICFVQRRNYIDCMRLLNFDSQKERAHGQKKKLPVLCIKSIAELTHSSSKTDYKRDLISCTNLDARLRKSNFDISKFWCRIPDNSFKIFGNDSDQIKL